MSLPSAYQEVEYIENTWATNSSYQYIDTWINATANIKIELEITPNLSYISENAILWTDWSASTIFLMFYSSKYRLHYWGNYWDSSATITETESTVITSSTWITVNWTSTAISWWSSYSWTWSILLFAVRWFSSNPSRYKPAVFKCHWMKMYDGDSLIRDLVPCYRKSDDVIWMYDLVNDTFYTNSWTWTFTKWPDAIVEWYVVSRILWWGPANDGTATNKQRLIWGTEPPPPPTPVLFEIETDFRNYSNISDVYALWWWAWAKGSMSPAVNTSYWFYCSNYNSAWWWCWLYYDISSYMSNAKKITMNLTWTLPAATYQGNESLCLTDTTVLDSTGSDTAPNRLYTQIKWWPYNDVTCIWKRLNWTWSKLYEYWSSTYNWDTDMTWEINLETWVITCTFTQPASISMTYTLTSSELSWVKSTLKYAAFNFTTYTTWLNDTIKTAHIIIE